MNLVEMSKVKGENLSKREDNDAHENSDNPSKYSDILLFSREEMFEKPTEQSNIDK